MRIIPLLYFITQVFFLSTVALGARTHSIDDVISNIENQVVVRPGNAKSNHEARKTVCTKSPHSNFRRGPGVTFPIEYEILKAGYPLKVIKNVDTWYAVEDFEGRIAWLGAVNVRTKCGAIVSNGGFAKVYFAPSTKSKELFSLEKGYIIHEIDCPSTSWCSAVIQEKQGWIEKKDVWGNL